MKNFRRLLYCAAAATALFVAACGGGSSSTAPPTGTVNVQVTDAPSKDFDHVWVTISEVRFHTSNAAAANDPGWLKYPLAMPVTFDLAALSNGALASSLNGGISLPAGTYQQIRLVLVADTANLASSAAALGLTYNDQVDWTDANGTAHLAPLEIAAPSQGIGINGTFTVSAATPLNLAVDFDIGHDVVKFMHGSNNAYTLKPNLQYFDLAQAGAVNGSVATAALCATSAATAPVNCAYNLVIKAEHVSADGTHHEATRFTTIRPDGTFTLYPIRVPAGQSATSVDVLIRGRNMDTILVRNVPVTAASTPTGAGATSLSSVPLPLTIDTEYTANAAAALTPTGAWANFYQTLTGTGQAEIPYEVRYRHMNPFTGIFTDAIPLSTGPVQLGTFVAGGTPNLVANTPAQGSGGFLVFAAASGYVRAEASTDPLTGANAAAGFAIPALAVVPNASADSISGTITQASPNAYDSGFLVIVRMGAIVQTQPLGAVLAANSGMGGTFTVNSLPGGSAMAPLPGVYYYLYARVWKASNPTATLKRIDFNGFADLTTGSATGLNVTLN